MRYVNLGLFVVVSSLILFFGHRYLWRRLVRDTHLSGLARELTTAGLVIAGVSVPLALFAGRLVDRTISQPVTIVAYSWLGFAALLLMALGGVDLVKAMTSRWRRRRATSASAPPVAGNASVDVPPSEAVPEVARRQFLARATAGGALATAAGIFTIGAKNALGEVEVVEVPVRLARLPKALDGFTIVQISDVHIGPMLDGRFLEGIVEKINAQKPDLVVITGDLVDAAPRFIDEDVARLRRIIARHGTLFVTGNHEYYSGADEWLDFLPKIGVRPLMNRRVIVGDSSPLGASFDVAGIPDPQAGNFFESHTPNLTKTLLGRDPERELVLLAHRPNPIEEAAAAGVGLQLSGHTHGGQFFPLTAFGPLVHKYNAGLHRHGESTQIYVSRGTGFWGPPIRLLAPSEITTFRLWAG